MARNNSIDMRKIIVYIYVIFYLVSKSTGDESSWSYSRNNKTLLNKKKTGQEKKHRWSQTCFFFWVSQLSLFSQNHLLLTAFLPQFSQYALYSQVNKCFAHNFSKNRLFIFIKSRKILKYRCKKQIINLYEGFGAFLCLQVCKKGIKRVSLVCLGRKWLQKGENSNEVVTIGWK